MKVLDILKLLLTRVFVLYAVAFLIILPFLNYDKGMRNAFAQTLSRLTPPINYYKLFVDKKDNFDPWKLEQCVNYHEKITYYFPFQAAEAYGMLGFCYHRLGDEAKAIDSYQKSVDTNPLHFWPYYNLGVIAYNQGQYAKAFLIFSQAVKLDPVKSVYLLAHSKIYLDVKASDPKVAASYSFEEGVALGFRKAFKGMVLSLIKSKNYQQSFNVAMNGLSHGAGDQGFYLYYAALSLFNLGDFEKAFLFFEKAAKEDTHNAEAYYYMGLCLQAGGRADLAKEYFTTATKLHAQYGSYTEKQEQLDVQFF